MIERGRRAGSLQRLLPISGIVGPSLYAIVVTVLGLLWPGYNPIRQYMSELGAVDAPHAFVMNALGFQLLGISMFAFGFGLYRCIGLGWESRIGVALIVVAGVSLVGVGLSPCDPGCMNVSTIGVRHTITATIAPIAMTIGMFVISLGFRKDGQWENYWVFTRATAVIAMFLSPLPMLELFEPWAGLLQRLGMGLALFWIVATAIKQLRM